MNYSKGGVSMTNFLIYFIDLRAGIDQEMWLWNKIDVGVLMCFSGIIVLRVTNAFLIFFVVIKMIYNCQEWIFFVNLLL